jgi:hypothetical protein
VPLTTDDFGRPQVSDPIRQSISEAFSAVPENKRGAFLLIADQGDDTVRAHVAAKLGDNWKVAAGAGWEWGKKSPTTAFVAVVGTW